MQTQHGLFTPVAAPAFSTPVTHFQKPWDSAAKGRKFLLVHLHAFTHQVSSHILSVPSLTPHVCPVVVGRYANPVRQPKVATGGQANFYFYGPQTISFSEVLHHGTTISTAGCGTRACGWVFVYPNLGVSYVLRRKRGGLGVP